MRRRGSFPRLGILTAVIAVCLGLGISSSAADSPPPSNDNFANAQVVPGPFGSRPGTIAGATAEVVNHYDESTDPNAPDDRANDAANDPIANPANEPDHGDPAGAHDAVTGTTAIGFPPTGTTGTSAFANPANHSIWFTWTAPFSATTTMSTVGSNFDTVMSVYVLNDPHQPAGYGNLNLIAGNDDCAFIANSPPTSCVKFSASSGTQYWIAVDAMNWGFDPSHTTVQFNWLEAAQNDSLTTAPVLSGPAQTVQGSNLGATLDPNDPSTIAGQQGDASVYYKWTPPAGTVEIGTSSQCTANFDLLLGVFTQGTGGSIDAVPGAQVSIPAGTVSSTAFVADGVTQYLILIEGRVNSPGGDTGTFCLNALTTNGATLSLEKSVSPLTAYPGDLLTYTLITHNNGEGPALNATLDDPLPAGTTFVSATGAGGGCHANGSVSCSLGMIESGASASVTIVLALAPGATGTVTNTATASALNSPPSSASATTTVLPAADVSLAKTAMPSSITAGGNLAYQLVVTNNGPFAATGVKLTDAFPAGTTWVSADDPTGTCTHTAASLVCPIGTMAVGASKTFFLYLTPPIGATSETNTAFIESTTHDPAPQNNSSSATTTIVPSADVSITKLGPAAVLGGGLVSYTIGASNLGPAAVNVQVSDQLPADAVSPSTTTTGCSISQTNLLTCNLGTVASGGAPILIGVSFTLPASTTLTTLLNMASITSDTGDPNSNNNSATAQTTVTPLADLSLQKTVSPGTVSPGGALTYTLVVSNAGPGSTHAVISDPLATGMSFTSASGATCAAVSGIVQCSAIALASGASATITLVETLSATSTASSVVNTATVAAQELNDANLANNSATATASIQSNSGCTKVGDVNGGLNAKGGLQINVEADCDGADKKHPAAYLHHAHIHVDGLGFKIDAESTDDGKKAAIKGVAINGSTATITGTWNGQAFTLVLTDNGQGSKGAVDTYSFTYGGHTYTNAGLKTDGNIHVGHGDNGDD